MLGARQVLEPVLPEVAQRDAFGKLVVDELPRSLGEQCLAAVRRRADARGARHVEADVARGGERGLARVDPDADPERGGRELRQQSRGAPNRGRRTREGREERVPLRVDDAPVARGDDDVDEPGVLLEQLGVGVLADVRQQLGRALDVGEHERHGPAGQLGHAPSLSPRARPV